MISVLVSFSWFWVISFNPDNLPRMRGTSFGCFLPFGFAALGLWFA
jgi:hypothetical protein